MATYVTILNKMKLQRLFLTMGMSIRRIKLPPRIARSNVTVAQWSISAYPHKTSNSTACRVHLHKLHMAALIGHYLSTSASARAQA